MKAYSDTRAKVHEETSNDPWGPSGTQMNELVQLTYNQCAPSIHITSKLGVIIVVEIISLKSWKCWTSD